MTKRVQDKQETLLSPKRFQFRIGLHFNCQMSEVKIPPDRLKRLRRNFGKVPTINLFQINAQGMVKTQMIWAEHGPGRIGAAHPRQAKLVAQVVITGKIAFIVLR